MKPEDRDLFVDKAEEYGNQYYHAPQALYGRTPEGERVQLAIIGAGRTDDVTLFRVDDSTIFEDEDECLILTEHDSLEYMGLEIYKPGGKQVTGVFLDGADFRDLEHMSQKKRVLAMLNYFE